jgi:hypothetical protein
MAARGAAPSTLPAAQAADRGDACPALSKQTIAAAAVAAADDTILCTDVPPSSRKRHPARPGGHPSAWFTSA